MTDLSKPMRDVLGALINGGRLVTINDRIPPPAWLCMGQSRERVHHNTIRALADRDYIRGEMGLAQNEFTITPLGIKACKQ